MVIPLPLPQTHYGKDGKKERYIRLKTIFNIRGSDNRGYKFFECVDACESSKSYCKLGSVYGSNRARHRGRERERKGERVRQREVERERGLLHFFFLNTYSFLFTLTISTRILISLYYYEIKESVI